MVSAEFREFRRDGPPTASAELKPGRSIRPRPRYSEQPRLCVLYAAGGTLRVAWRGWALAQPKPCARPPYDLRHGRHVSGSFQPTGLVVASSGLPGAENGPQLQAYPSGPWP